MTNTIAFTNGPCFQRPSVQAERDAVEEAEKKWWITRWSQQAAGVADDEDEEHGQVPVDESPLIRAKARDESAICWPP